MCLISPHKRKSFMFHLHQLYTTRFAIFYLHPVFYFVIPYIDLSHDNSQNRGNDHDNVLCVLLFFFIWCHFVYLECFWKKKKKQHKKILEWMQICNCAFLYQLVWLNVGLEWCINNYVDMLTKVDGVAFKNGLKTFAYVRWNPMMSKASWRTNSQMSVSL